MIAYSPSLYSARLGAKVKIHHPLRRVEAEEIGEDPEENGTAYGVEERRSGREEGQDVVAVERHNKVPRQSDEVLG